MCDVVGAVGGGSTKGGQKSAHTLMSWRMVCTSTMSSARCAGLARDDSSPATVHSNPAQLLTCLANDTAPRPYVTTSSHWMFWNRELLQCENNTPTKQKETT